MRDYSIILAETWTGPTGRALRDPTLAGRLEARVLQVYLFSAPGNNMYGLYYRPVPTMSMETGLTEREIRAALETLRRLHYCDYDASTEYVWVCEMAAIQLRPLPLKPGDWKINAANKFYRSLPPKLPFLGPFYDRYVDDLRLEPPRRSWDGGTTAIAPAPPADVPAPADDVLFVELSPKELKATQAARFEQFWTVYPKHAGKKAAREQWEKLNPNEQLTETIIAKVIAFKRSERWLRDGGTAIPDPMRFIRDERWTDEIYVGPHLSKTTLANAAAVGAFYEPTTIPLCPRCRAPKPCGCQEVEHALAR